MFDVNVKTALNASKAALGPLSAHAGGRIVNIGALAEELKDKGVTVNAVLLSIIDTPPNRRDMPDADFSRWVKPEELGAVIGFLLSARCAMHHVVEAAAVADARQGCR